MATPLVVPEVQGRRYARGIWPMEGTPDDGLFADVTVGERSEGASTITKHPTDTNSNISDHVFDEPRALTLTIGFSAKEGATFTDIYTKLDEWRTSATLLMVQTGKRLYQNMLIAYVNETTAADTENVLWFDLGVQQINVVSMLTGELAPRPRQKLPKKTASTEAQGAKQVAPEKPKKSALKDLRDNLGKLASSGGP